MIQFYVLTEGGNFNLATSYEQVNSVLDDYLTHNGIASLASIYAVNKFAFFGHTVLDDTMNLVIDSDAYAVGTFGTTSNDLGTALLDAVTDGMSGPQAIAAAFGGSDFLYGNVHNDVLEGFAAADRLFGYDGNDSLSGDAGTDTLQGEKGDDLLTGGADGDFFVFGDIVAGTAGGWGHDTITDFTHKRDKLDFSGASAIHNLRNLTITTVGGDTIISDQAGDTIKLAGVTDNKLTAKDFIFASGGSAHPEISADHHPAFLHEVGACLALV